MPRTGRPPKPTELKRRLGNPGRRPLPSSNVIALAPVVGQLVTPLADGDGLVTALLDSAASAWIALPDRLTVLELVRTAWDRRALLLEDLRANGESYAAEGQSGRRYYRRPEAVELESLEKRITTWLSLLGLTPTDRSRLGVAEVKARNRLEELQVRRATRLARNPAG